MNRIPPPPGGGSRRLTVALLAAALLTQACGGSALYVRPRLAPGCGGCGVDEAALDARLILIGDTGDYKPGHANYALLDRQARRDPQRTLVLFLGDNVYPRGMPADPEGVGDERVTSDLILQQQLDAVRFTGARTVFIPGNHDWDRSGPRGQARLLAQQRYVERHAYPGNVRLLPADGCPGPVWVDQGARLRVVVTDSEWLLTPPARRRAAGCAWGDADAPRSYHAGDNAAVYAKLRQIVASSGDRTLVFSSHHPLRTRGPHGSFVSLQHWVFPLTVFKKWLWIPLPLLYPPLRYGVKRSDQDLVGGQNRRMVEALMDIYVNAGAGPVVAAAGHEHSLQVFEEPGSPLYHLVSGSGVKAEPTGTNDLTLFKHAAVGLMVLDYLSDGRVSLRVLEPRGGQRTEQVFSMWLEGAR